MIEWYNNLTVCQQVWTWALLVLCTIGVVRCFWLCLCSWILDVRFIKEYLETAQCFAKKFRNNTNNGNECAYLIRKTAKATDILGRDRFSYPEIDLESGIKYKALYTSTSVDDKVDLLHATCLEWDEERKSKRWIYLLQLLVPILFWVFRGIEVVLQFIAYLLKELGWDYNDDKKGRMITILSILFTFITGMSSLMAYLKIELF